MSFMQMLEQSVRRKFKTDERVGEWWAKYNHARKLRLHRMFHNQNGQCYYCQKQCWLHQPNSPPQGIKALRATVEHKIPVSQNGTDHTLNTVMACKYCNTARGTMDIEQFKHLVETNTLDKFLGAQRSQKGEKRTKKQQKNNPRTVMMLAYVFHHSKEFEIALEKLLIKRNG